MIVLGDRLEYRWVGEGLSGTPIVMLHDSLGSVGTWRDFPDRLSAATGCPVLLYSRLGYGRSDRLHTKRTKTYLHFEGETVLPELLRQVDISKAILFGHSDGASIALLCAAAHPSLVQALIVEAPHVFVEDITLAGIRAARGVYETTDLPARLARYHDDPDGVFRAWQDIWLDPEFRDWNIESSLPRIQCPILLIQGADDEYGTAAQLNAIAKDHADRTILLLDQCGHSPHRDQPEQVIAETAQFIRQAAK